MGKRMASDADPRSPQDEPHLKRQRVENAEEATTARQLLQALVFEQGTASNFRSGLSLLKKLLDSLLYPTDEHDLPPKRTVLREYLDAQKKDRGESAVEFLPHFFQAWDFAAQTGFDALLSQVTASLALLLKFLSGHADFLAYGTLLCKAVLQTPVARRLSRSLSAPPAKENIVSPALRLLNEITRFNEGAHAKAVYAKRDLTLEPKILGRNISLWKDAREDPELQKRKPSIRINAVRYLLSHLHYQDELAKAELLSNTNVVRAIFDHLHADPPFLVFDILDAMKDHVFLDRTIPRHVKSRILTGKTLSNIAGLYKHQTVEDAKEGQKSPNEAAHEFLRMMCTSPAYGVMLPSNGYYPPASEEDDGDAVMEDAAEYLTEFNIDPSENMHSRRRIRNVILGEFIQSLRPYASTLQQELVVAIFKACPELVADYFIRKESFNYDPKLTSTWIGYSSFLYQTIEIPFPEYFGGRRSYREYPPATSTIIQSILPQPLTQQVLTKCLNSSSDLVNFFAVRVLVVAFRKLQVILQEFNAAAVSRSSKMWEQGAQRLISEFCKRCPPMKTAVLAFRRPAFHQKDMMREAITRLLRLYFEVTPQAALQEKFDVSIPLCNALMQAEKPTEAPEETAFRILELEHWIQIARHSPSMRWWQKNKTLPHSPFVTLLKLIVASTKGELYTGIKALLVTILRDHEILQVSTHPDALDALVASLGAPNGSPSPSAQVLEFLDDCCARFTKGPIKYFDDLDALQEHDSRQGSTRGPFSPLLMAFAEQWLFKGSKAEKGSSADPLAQWLSKLLYLLRLIGEDETLLALVRDSLVSSANQKYQQALKDSFLWKMGKEKAKEALRLATGANFSDSERSNTSPLPPEKPNEPAEKKPTVDLEAPPEEDEKHMGLSRWRKKDIEESVDDGDIGELLLCLCSKHAEIRLQAVSNIRQLIAKVEANNDSDLLQLRILLSEALETAQPIADSTPLPYVGGVFAARAVNVLADPTHFMFGKINQFLMKRPEWTVENLPRYFCRNIINNEPDQDGSYRKEVDWLLDYLIDCLRTGEDMEIFRTKNIFERLLSYFVSASCSISAKEKIVRLLLRAAAVGGSTTLITRCGLVSWIQMRLDNGDHRHGMLRLLTSRIWETCDQAKVEEWSSGAVEEAIAVMMEDGGGNA